jgi:hypothetical protein
VLGFDPAIAGRVTEAAGRLAQWRRGRTAS